MNKFFCWANIIVNSIIIAYGIVGFVDSGFALGLLTSIVSAYAWIKIEISILTKK